MADRSTIEWTDATWNPIGGCSRVSEGCRNCYAEVMAARFSDPGQWGHGLAERVKLPNGTTDHRWTGKLRFNEKALTLPLDWKKPRKIFVNSTSDLFHESVPGEWIDQVFAVMALCPQHTFQILTKRPGIARAYLTDPERRLAAASCASRLYATGMYEFPDEVNLMWPPPNLWLGTSVEDQATADARIPHLLATPAAVRFISAEPLLGPVRLDDLIVADGQPGEWHVNALDSEGGDPADCAFGLAEINWVIVGGESGPGARPMHPDWARSLRDQCQKAGVPFFFKQWGEWAPVTIEEDEYGNLGAAYAMDGCSDPAAHRYDQEALFWQGDDLVHWPLIETRSAIGVRRVGKKAAGRLLDGREWNEVPHA